MPTDYFRNQQLEDGRDKYDPSDPLTKASVRLTAYNNSFFKPLEERMREFLRLNASKNIKDRGEGEL